MNAGRPRMLVSEGRRQDWSHGLINRMRSYLDDLTGSVVLEIHR